MTHAFWKDTKRSILRSWNRYLSILLIVAIGVGFFAGIRAAGSDMRLSSDKYYKQQHLMDLQIISTLGFSDKDLDALKNIPGIDRISGSKYVDCYLVEEDRALIRVYSLFPEDKKGEAVNELLVLDGRLPSELNECVMDNKIMSAQGYQIGDSVLLEGSSEDIDILNQLEYDSFTIVGVVNSPLYIDFTKRGTTTAGSGSLDGYVYVLESAHKADYYSEIYCTYTPCGDLDCYSDEYNTHIEELKAAVEAIEQERAVPRMDEMKVYLRDELVNGNQKISDAEKELFDGKQKLLDAEKELSDGREKVEKAEKDLEDGRKELEKQQKQYEQYEQDYEEGKTELAAAKIQMDALRAGQAELLAARSTVNALFNRMLNLEDNSPLLKPLADSLRDTLNDSVDGLGDSLYDSNGNVTHQTVLDTKSQADAYFTAAESQIAAATKQYNMSEAALDTARSDLDTYKKELRKAEDKLSDGEKELEEAREKLTDGEAEFAEKKASAQEDIAKGELSLKRGKKILSDAEEWLNEIEPATWYLSSRSEFGGGFAEFRDDASRMDRLSTVFPIFFLLVAALVCLTTMSRMIEEDRTEIGTLKALGYTESEIRLKYLIYSLSATLLGSMLGLVIGFRILPTVIYDAYRILYELPDITAPFQWKVALACTGGAVLLVTIVTCSTCRSVLREVPASIMKPKAPPAGKSLLIERSHLWKRLSFSRKVTIRNLLRYKKRVLMTIFGIAGSAALVLTGYGLNDAIGDIVNNQFKALFVYDLMAGFTDDHPEDVEALFRELDEDKDVSAWMKQYRTVLTTVGGVLDYDVNVTVSESQSNINNFIRMQIRETGEPIISTDDSVILTEKVATLLNIRPGDSITLENGDKEQYTLTVTDITENYATHFIYLSADTYREVFGEDPIYNCVIMNLTNPGRWDRVAERYLQEGTVLSVSSTEDSYESFKHVTDSLILVVIVLIVSAAILAFVVLFNLTNINITERTREIATLKVLGFYDGEVSAYIYRENIILTVLGIGVGLVLGLFLNHLVVTMAEIDSIMFGRNIYFLSFLYAALITAGFSLLVNFVMHFKLKKISMVESMKSVD